jgi:hypothetical protein
MVLQYIQIVLCIATVATGLLSLFAPRSTPGFTGLSPQGGRGISEIRAVLGGLFIALGAAPLAWGGDTFRMLGAGYLAIAAVRIVSIFWDKSSVRSNWISLGVEILFGVLLVL